jgi:hypothetical protein
VSDDERRAFAVPALGADYDGDLGLLDPDDEDERRMLIQAEHPEFGTAVESDLREVHVAGTNVNPVLHIAMHEIVTNRLLANEPPEMWETAQQLLAGGYERHEVMHMLASVVSAEVFDVLRDQPPHEIERVRTDLAALPESWEAQRAATPEDRHANRAERRARKRSK